MYKKVVASFMTALMAAMTLVSPALGATALNTYPSFLGNVGDFYIVVGENAAASDVAGAIDIAANLAQLSFKETTITGTTTTGLTGTERKIVIPQTSSGGQIAGSTANNLPTKLKAFHYSGLKEGTYEYRGVKHNYHEEVELDDSGTTLTLVHGTGSPVNGTLKMRLENNATTYKFVFDDDVASGDFNAQSANSTTYQNPLKVTIAGREFQIVAIPSTTSFTALIGEVQSLSDGESMTVGDLTVKVVTSYSSSTAKLEVTDPDGNVVKSTVNSGTTESISYGGATYNLKVLDSRATASGVPGFATVLFGKGDVEKTFDGGSEATVTEFGSDWKISGKFATAGRVQKGDYIKVAYEPSSLPDDKRYYTPGSVFNGPNNYFELKFAGYTPDKFAQVTIEPVTGITVYTSTASTGYSTFSGLNGIKITSDVSGTITNGTNGYDEAYILFNASSDTANWRPYYWVAFKDKATGRIVNTTTSFPAVFYNTSVELGLSYGGPGAEKTFNVLVARYAGSNSTLLGNVTIANSTQITDSKDVLVAIAFQNKTTPSTTSSPELRIGTDDTAQSNDVKVLIESSLSDVSTQVGTVVTDDGLQVYTVKSNTEGNKVVLGVPPETVYGLVQFGKIGETVTTEGGTVKEVVPVTTAVAKLDSEVTSSDKTGKHLVLVGGPCVNSLVADLNTAGKFAYGCADWPGRNFALVQVVDDAFATGKQVVVVAGTRAEDTRLASSVLQNYATKLSDVTASSVEVTGTALATATITPQ